MVDLTYTIDEALLKKMHLTFWFNRKNSWIFFLGYILLFVCTLMLIFLPSLNDNDNLITIFFFVLALVILPFSLFLRINREVKLEMERIRMTGQEVLKINLVFDSRINIKNLKNDNSTSYEYKSIYKVMALKDMLVILFKANLVMGIPYSAFKNNEREILANILATHCIKGNYHSMEGKDYE